MGMIHVDNEIGELKSSALFHIIYSKTSYELLLGCPSMHEARVVPLTWHQCFKYIRDSEEKRVVAEIEPFTKEEAHFAYAKFYGDSKVISEALPIFMPEVKPKEGNQQHPHLPKTVKVIVPLEAVP